MRKSLLSDDYTGKYFLNLREWIPTSFSGGNTTGHSLPQIAQQITYNSQQKWLRASIVTLVLSQTINSQTWLLGLMGTFRPPNFPIMPLGPSENGIKEKKHNSMFTQNIFLWGPEWEFHCQPDLWWKWGQVGITKVLYRDQINFALCQHFFHQHVLSKI